MPNIFDKALFRKPGFSIFEQSENRKQTIAIGRNVPVYYQELYAGDEIDINLVQITKFQPILAPIFHKFSVDFIPAFIPFRLIHDHNIWNADDFFNPATPDAFRPAVPMASAFQLYKDATKIVGSIWDYLRYPKFLWLLLNLQEDKYTIANVNTTLHYADLFDLTRGRASAYNVAVGTQVTSQIYCMNKYFIDKYPTGDWTKYWNNNALVSEEAFWTVLYDVSGLKRDAAIEEYINYLHYTLMMAWINQNALASNVNLSLLPWICYNLLMLDWFKNTNITPVDYVYQDLAQTVQDLVANPTDSLLDTLQNNGIIIGDLLDSTDYVADCDKSLWQSDYFTSAFTNPQAGSTSVPIPVSGTIPQLSTARKLQWSLTKTLYAGKRLIDQIFVHRGVKSSDARMHRCEIIGHKVYNLRVDDVLQTSASQLDSSLADFAGFAQSAGGDHLCHYRAEEGGLVMVIARVRPRLEYMDATPRFLLKSDFYDFENPDFDNVGMQPIMRNELSFDSSLNTVTFGWQRKYAEYMCGLDSVCGDLATSMDYWHAARQFRTLPQLNANFITMDADRDGFNRIFAVPANARPIVQYLHFDVKTSRPLSRYVSFDY